MTHDNYGSRPPARPPVDLDRELPTRWGNAAFIDTNDQGLFDLEGKTPQDVPDIRHASSFLNPRTIGGHMLRGLEPDKGEDTPTET